VSHLAQILVTFCDLRGISKIKTKFSFFLKFIFAIR